ncbi:MAG: S9 family peptidase, partial [Prevotella sp.]|nr:S9 family peptidase [Prevotella sp.]
MKKNSILRVLSVLTLMASAPVQGTAADAAPAPLTCADTTATETTISVTAFRLAGPFAVSKPFATDSVDVQGKKYDEQSLLSALPLQAEPQDVFSGSVLPSLPDSRSVGVLTFYLDNSDFLKGTIKVKGPKNYKLYVDGKEAGDKLDLAPEHHTFAIRYLAQPSDSDSISVTIGAPCATSLAPATTVVSTKTAHPYMFHDLTDGRRVRGVSLSADGKYVCVSYQTTERNGNSRWDYELRDVKSGRLLARPSHNVRWMPRSTAWIEEEREQGQRVLYKVEPLTGSRTRWTAGLPDGSYTVSPTEDFLIVSIEAKGTKEDAGVFEVLEMDDRQPNWRNRNYLCRFDVTTGLTQRLTFGSHGHYLCDISADGQKLLVASSHSRLAKRPTEVSDYYIIDAKTMHTDTLMMSEGFLGGAVFSPDASQLLFTGTPEAFDRIGCQLPADVTPSMTENELFLYDIATRKVTPLTKDFDPSVDGSPDWSWADGKIYFRAECRDYVYLYQLDPKTGETVQIACQGDDIYRFDMATHAPLLAYLSYNTLEPASAYII